MRYVLRRLPYDIARPVKSSTASNQRSAHKRSIVLFYQRTQCYQAGPKDSDGARAELAESCSEGIRIWWFLIGSLFEDELMLEGAVDNIVGLFSPAAKLRRVQARRVLRSYSGADPSRLNSNRKPRNLSADQELLGPFGADSMRAWARMLVRDNSYAWGVVDTIVSSVVGCGIKAQSQYETPDGSDVEIVNDARDKAWSEWCEVCEINGQYT